MTKEEIIKYLNIIKAFFLGSEHQPISDAYFALDEAIKALKQEPCEDCISRETARRIVDSGRTRQQMIDMILATPPVNPQEQYYKELAESYEKTINKLTKAIAEQEPKTGHWIVDREAFRLNIRGKQTFDYSVHCDKCEYRCDYTTDVKGSSPSNYCPNCGAKMESEEQI